MRFRAIGYGWEDGAGCLEEFESNVLAECEEWLEELISEGSITHADIHEFVDSVGWVPHSSH
jgi:hypothetical protein